ncbi:hypothetical protein OY671_011636, partial [Metschnikowia pulcherrima]
PRFRVHRRPRWPGAGAVAVAPGAGRDPAADNRQRPGPLPDERRAARGGPPRPGAQPELPGQQRWCGPGRREDQRHHGPGRAGWPLAAWGPARDAAGPGRSPAPRARLCAAGRVRRPGPADRDARTAVRPGRPGGEGAARELPLQARPRAGPAPARR